MPEQSRPDCDRTPGSACLLAHWRSCRPWRCREQPPPSYSHSERDRPSPVPRPFALAPQRIAARQARDFPPKAAAARRSIQFPAAAAPNYRPAADWLEHPGQPPRPTAARPPPGGSLPALPEATPLRLRSDFATAWPETPPELATAVRKLGPIAARLL